MILKTYSFLYGDDKNSTYITLSDAQHIHFEQLKSVSTDKLWNANILIAKVPFFTDPSQVLADYVWSLS